MTKSLTVSEYTIGQARSQYSLWKVPPIVNELEAIFKELPDDELLTKLKGPRRRGPKGYNPSILWRCYVTYYVLGLPSVSDLIRLLYDNPYIAAACGIKSPHDMPSQPTFSRFFTKLSWWQFKAQVNKVFQRLTQRLYDTLPDFGKSVAMDATDLKACSSVACESPAITTPPLYKRAATMVVLVLIRHYRVNRLSVEYSG